MPDPIMPNFSLVAPVPRFGEFVLPPNTSVPPPLPPAVPATGQGDPITSGFMSALHEARAQGARAAQAGAQLVGATDTAQSLSDYADQAHATAQSYANPEYENAPWYSPSGIAYHLAQMVPTTAAALGVGGLAALTAPEAAAGAGGLAAATGLRALLGGAARRAAIGTSAAMFPFAAGENVQRQIAERGELTEPGKALAWGAPEAVLQGWLPGHLEQYFGKGILQGIKHSVIAQSIAAGGTEAMTGLMGDPDRGMADRASDITRQALSGGLLGGIVGGAFGGMRALAGKPASAIKTEDLPKPIDQALTPPPPPSPLSVQAVQQAPRALPAPEAPVGPTIEATGAPITGGRPPQDLSHEELLARLGALHPLRTSEGATPADRDFAPLYEELQRRAMEVGLKSPEGQKLLEYARRMGAPPQDLSNVELSAKLTALRPLVTGDPRNPADQAFEPLRQEYLRRAAETPPAPAPGAPAAAPMPVPEAPPAAPAPEVPRAVPALAPAGEPSAVVGAPKEPVAPVARAAEPAAPAPPVAPVIDFTKGKVKDGKALYDAATPEAQAQMRQPLIDMLVARGDKEATGVLKKWGAALDVLTSDGKLKPELRPVEPEALVAPGERLAYASAGARPPYAERYFAETPPVVPAPAAPTRTIVRDPTTGKLTMQSAPEPVPTPVSQDVTPAKPKTVVDQTDLEGIPAFLDRRAPKTDAPVETTADRAAALGDTAKQIGTLKVAPALKDQLSAEVDQLTSQLRGADRNPGYAPTINKKVMELRSTVEKLAQPPADQVASPGLEPSPRAEAVPAPAGDLDERIGAAQYALGKLRKVLGPNAAAMLDQHQDWLKAVNKAAVPDEYRAALAKDPEANPEADTLSDIPRPPKALVEYLAQQQRVLQELRALSGPESRARVISSRDGLPVTQLDADVTDMHQRGVKPTDIADHIIENSASPEEAEIMARLKPFIPENVKTVYRDGVADKEGEYFPGTKTSALYNAANAAQTFIHEMVHATLSRALEGTSTAAEAIRGIYEQLKGKGDHAGITDEHEMVAEAFANPTYRDFLKSQFVKGTSLWDRFIDAARRFIGLPDRLSNAFERIMSLGDDLLKEQKEYPNDAWVGRDSFARVTDKAASDTAAAADVARGALEQRLAGGKLNMTDKVRGIAFGLLNSQRFAPLYAKFAPSIAEKIKLEQQHAALDSAMSRPTQLADRLSSKVHGDERTNLNKVMNDATFFQLDPRKELSNYPEIHDNPDLVNRFNENKLRYDLLSQPAKTAYEGQRAVSSMNIQALMALRLQSAMRAVGILKTDAFDTYRNDDRLWDNPQVAEKHFKDAVTDGIETLNDYYTKQSADLATTRAAIKAGLPDDQLEKMTAQRDDLQANVSKVGSVLNDVKKQQIQVDKAPYFHLGRTGDKFLTAKFITDDDGKVDQGKLAKFADHLEKAGFKDIAVNAGGGNDTFYTKVKNVSELDLLRQTIQDAQAKGLLSKDGAAWGEASTMYSTLSKNSYEHVVEELLAHRQQPPEGISDELAANWQKATAHQAEELRRTLLNLLPENAMGRQMAQRRNVQGYDTNMLQNNLMASKIMTRGLAHMAFAPDMGAVSSRMLDDVKNVNRTQDTNTALAVGQAVNELMLRDQIKQSSYTPLTLADGLHKLTHAIHIGLSPPYVFMLMSQLMTTAWPELAKTHGLGGSASALFKVEGDAFKVIRAIMNSPDAANVGVTRAALEKAGVDQTRINQVMRAVSNGVLDTAMYSTQAHEQAPLSIQKLKGAQVANAMGKYAELFPRLSTLFAAHDLYGTKPVSGMTAEDFAHGAVTESQGDWTPGLSARQTSRGGVAGRLSPLILQFMGWRIIMTGKMYNEVRNAFTPGEDRAAATRWLIGHAAATTMLAGTLGLPALSIAAGAYDKIMDWVTDRDDHDLTASYRGWLSDTFGKDMGEIIARGLPRAAGMDFPRFSEADIIPGSSVVGFMSEKRKLEDMERDWAKSLVGPAVGDVFNMVAAARDFTNGDFLNGMIKMSPEALKAPAEAYRLSERGFVNNLTGQQLPLGKPTTYDIALTMLGIDPGKAAEYAEVNREAVGLNTMRELNSSNIVRHMELAYNRRDPAMMSTWQAESQRWQMQHPGLMPPAASFQRELDNHLRQSAIAQGLGLPVGVRPQDIDVRRQLRYGNIGQRPQ